MADHVAAYQVVQDRFAEVEEAFAVLEAAHRRGEYVGPEHDVFLASLDAVRAAIDEFRMVVDRERRSR